MGWRERHEWFGAAFGPSWRSTILGIGAIGFGLVLMGIGALLVAFETTRTTGVAISGQALALLVAGIGLVWMREERQHQTDVTKLKDEVREEARDVARTEARATVEHKDPAS